MIIKGGIHIRAVKAQMKKKKPLVNARFVGKLQFLKTSFFFYFYFRGGNMGELPAFTKRDSGSACQPWPSWHWLQVRSSLRTPS